MQQRRHPSVAMCQLHNLGMTFTRCRYYWPRLFYLQRWASMLHRCSAQHTDSQRPLTTEGATPFSLCPMAHSPAPIHDMSSPNPGLAAGRLVLTDPRTRSGLEGRVGFILQLGTEVLGYSPNVISLATAAYHSGHLQPRVPLLFSSAQWLTPLLLFTTCPTRIPAWLQVTSSRLTAEYCTLLSSLVIWVRGPPFDGAAVSPAASQPAGLRESCVNNTVLFYAVWLHLIALHCPLGRLVWSSISRIGNAASAYPGCLGLLPAADRKCSQSRAGRSRCHRGKPWSGLRPPLG